jgi:hypothetical protein
MDRASLNTQKGIITTMKTVNEILILLILVLFSTQTVALEIQAPEKMQSYAPFTFRATLPATDSFNTATVHFDNILVATVYPTGTCAIQPEWIPFIIHCATWDANPKTNEGLTAIVTHTGFAKGAHTIAVQTQGSTSEYLTVTLHVIDALDASEKETLDASMGTLTTRVEELETYTTNTEQKVYETQSELLSVKESTQTALDDVTNRLNIIEKPEPSMLTQNDQQGFNIPFLNGTGLVSGGNLPIIGIGILLIAGLLFVFTRGKSNGRFGGNNGGSSTPFFEGTLDSLFKGVPSDSKLSGRPEPQPKKWAADSEDEKGLRQDIEENPPERINFGDLIKQERD